MKPALEELLIKEIKYPSFEKGFYYEKSYKRVRAVFAGVTIADSKRVMLYLEPGRFPIYYFPREDVQTSYLQETEHHTFSPLKGEASYWNVQVGERVAERAGWGYPNPLPTGPQLGDYVAFYWDKMDAWYEEDEQVFVHVRDPYKRIEVLPSSRHIRIVLGGVTIAESKRPYLLLEPGLPPRYYLPLEDISMEKLSPSTTTTRCPYKGEASYWNVQVGERVYKDIVWSYLNPLPACLPITGLLCFFNERIDALYIDDALVPTPQTMWSEGE